MSLYRLFRVKSHRNISPMDSLDSSVVESTTEFTDDDTNDDYKNECVNRYVYDSSEITFDNFYNSDNEHQGHNFEHGEIKERIDKQYEEKERFDDNKEEDKKVSENKYRNLGIQEYSNHGKDECDDVCWQKFRDNFKVATVDKFKDELCDFNSKDLCDHKYEVGVVVVCISSKYVRVVGPLGDNWIETSVDFEQSLVFVEGVRMRKVTDSIKVGTMGHMVLTECIKCGLHEMGKDMAIAVPCLLWFGDLRPAVRGAMGRVVGKLGDRMVVQLEGPPASRVVRLVLFYSKSIVHREIVLQTRVMVWAWSRQHQGKNKGVEMFLEGAALTRVRL